MYIDFYRSLTESATGRNAGEGSLVNKLTSLESLKIVDKTKMSMHSRLKLLGQLKDFFNKSSYDKNLQLMLNKEWIDFIQKLTFAQIETIRKYSPDDIRDKKEKLEKTDETKEKDELQDKKIIKSVPTTLPTEKSEIMPKIKKVYIFIIILYIYFLSVLPNIKELLFLF